MTTDNVTPRTIANDPTAGLVTGSESMPTRRARPLDAVGFRQTIGAGWTPAVAPLHLPDGLDAASARHRRRLRDALPGRRIAIASGRAPVRSNDTDYRFRPDSDFVWLTGCQAEGAVLVVHPSVGTHDAALYLRRPAGPDEADFFANPRDGQMWTGPVPDLTQWSAKLGIECRPIEELPTALRGAVPPVMSAPGAEPLVDAMVSPDPGDASLLRSTLAELRRVKDHWELEQIRTAVAATIQGFDDVAAELPAALRGGGERWLEGTFDRRARASGNGPGYSSVIAAGSHAPILHWMRNDGAIHPGDLVLVDAGVETRTLYTADVTRTMPADGTFTTAQRHVYSLVHAAHTAALNALRPGADYADFDEAAMRTIVEGLVDWELLDVSADEALSPMGQFHRRYIVCATGHFIGLDVHDCAAARPSTYRDGKLEPGMTLAIEPGLYFHQTDATVPPELRGLGIRIEDNLIITKTGHENLTSGLASTPDGLERWVQQRTSQ